ncbi:MAG: thymidine phosphorylase [Oscillospiraceae bacterium]|nr:thymidine phosphorylase [Oscillospiraceae bacterium]
MYTLITKKRRGEELTHEEIDFIVRGYTFGEISDAQMAAFLMAVCFNGMTEEELVQFTDSMIITGKVYTLHDELDGVCVDKHSTGGVGDKMTLIDGPIVAACGVYVPKMSGRGLGHTGGTIDKLHAIPGFVTDISHEEFIRTVRSAGLAVMSQTDDLVPADRKIYALRDNTATVESIPLIASSIMSKKLATGADGIVLDVKYGNGAFMKDIGDAEKLGDTCVSLAGRYRRGCTAVLSDMNKPLGRMVGNALEVAEAADFLMGKTASPDVEELSHRLSTAMLMSAGFTEEEAVSREREALASGRAFECLERMVSLQHGDVRCLTDHTLMGTPRYTERFRAGHSGRITAFAAEKTGLSAMYLGAGRRCITDEIDTSAGIEILHTVGDEVREGDDIAILYSSSISDMTKALSLLDEAVTIDRE